MYQVLLLKHHILYRIWKSRFKLRKRNPFTYKLAQQACELNSIGKRGEKRRAATLSLSTKKMATANTSDLGCVCGGVSIFCIGWFAKRKMKKRRPWAQLRCSFYLALGRSHVSNGRTAASCIRAFFFKKKKTSCIKSWTRNSWVRERERKHNRLYERWLFLSFGASLDFDPRMHCRLNKTNMIQLS